MEHIIEKYYSKDNKVNNKKFIDVFESICINIEYWLSKEIFKNDISRIIYATDDNAFRKRIELLDNGKNENEQLTPEILDLPFGIYSVAGDIEPDDSDSTKRSVSNSVSGIYFPDEEINQRRVAVKQKFKAILFFNNRKTLREAFQLLFWEKEPEYEIHMYNEIEWRNRIIKLPMAIKIDELKSNSSEYKETDFLTKNEIFTITVEFTVRTYQLLINNIQKIFQLPMRFSNFIDTYEEDEEHIDYFTEQVVLLWAGQKFDIDVDSSKVDEDSEEIRAVKRVFDKNPYNIDVKRMPNDFTVDTITSYFEDNNSAGLLSYSFDEENSTTTSVRINYEIEKPEKLEELIFNIPTYKPVIVTDKEKTFIDINNLSEDSKYNIGITLKLNNGKIYYYNLTTQTKRDPNSKAPKKDKINYKAGLLGMHSY